MNRYNNPRFDMTQGHFQDIFVPTKTVDEKLNPKEIFEYQKKLIVESLIQNHPNTNFIPPRNDLKIIESTPVKTKFELVALIENISESEVQRILEQK